MALEQCQNCGSTDLIPHDKAIEIFGQESMILIRGVWYPTRIGLARVGIAIEDVEIMFCVKCSMLNVEELTPSNPHDIRRLTLN